MQVAGIKKEWVGLEFDTAEFEVTEAQVVPPVHGLEQVAGDEGLGFVSWVTDGSPVSQEPLGLLSQ